MTIQEIDTKIRHYESKIFQIKMYVNSVYPTNINELIEERYSLKHKVRELQKMKMRKLKLERILNENQK